MRFGVLACIAIVTMQFILAPSLWAAEESPKSLESGIIAEQGGSWAGRRTLIVEPGFQYSYNSSNRISLTGLTFPGFVIGLIQVDKVRRDILTPSLAFRFGVSDFFQINLKVPYIFRFDEYNNAPADSGEGSVITHVDDHNLGDIEGGLLFYLLSEKGARPQLVGGVKVKSRTGNDPYGLDTKQTTAGTTVPTEVATGTGHWGVEPYLTILKTTDPAVLFANAGYFYHIKRDIDGLGDVDPSDSINLSFGMAYALNDKLAVSTAYEQKIYTKLKIDGEKVNETDPVTATLLLGATYSFSPSSAMNVTVGVGLTEDSPDVQVSLNFPIRFSF